MPLKNMKSKLKSDIVYLGIIQALTFIIPLLTFPYLTRVLGIYGFGEYGYNIAMISYPLLLIQFGFDYSSTVTIANIKDDKTKLEKYITSVYVVKFLLLLFSVSVLFFLYQSNVISQERMKLIYWCSPALIASVFSSVYIFQGLNIIKNLAIINIITRAVCLPSVFLFVKNDSDIGLALFLYSLPLFLSSLISMIYLRVKRIKLFARTSVRNIINCFREGFVLFKLSCATSVYYNAIPLLIGYFYTVEHVGLYNVANTIKNAIASCLNVLFRALLPSISSMYADGDKRKANATLKRISKIIVPLVFLGCLVLMIISEPIVVITSGVDFKEAAIILNVLCFVLLFSVINNFLGLQSLVPLGHEKSFSEIVIKSSILGVLIITPLVMFYSSIGGAFGSLFAEVVVFFKLYRFHKNNKLKIYF